MKILVTGGLGFLGHNVVAQLEALGHNIVIIDTRTTYGIVPQAELDWLIAERRKKITTDRVHAVDIVDADGVDWLLKHYQFDTVIHLASFPRQKVVNTNPGRGSQTMSEGLLNLLESTVRHGVKKFVYISSSMVYGNFRDTYFDGASESHPTNPIGQYGIMKLAGEWLVRDYAERTGINYAIVRPSAVYGPLDVEDRVVSKFLLNAMRGNPIQVNGSDESLDFTYVDDAARGIVGATLSTINNTYNITRGQSRTLLEAAELAVQIVGQGTVQVNAADKNFPTRGQLSIASATTNFGYSPQVDIEQGFQQYYEWLTDSLYGIKKAV